MPVQVKDLKDQTGTAEPRPILHCQICNSEYSANKGDYFPYAEDHVLTCCEQPLELVVKKVVFVPVAH